MMTHYTWYENLSTLVGETPPDSITSRTIYQDEAIKVVVFGFDTGQSLSEHTASMPATVHLLSGEATVTMGDQSHQVGAGAWFHMDAHLPHSILATSPLTLLLILIKAQRQEAETA